MKKIPLGGKKHSGKFALVDDEDYEWLSQWHWYTITGYAVRQVRHDGKVSKIWMHRFINNTPAGFDTDHINGDLLDNRKSNLRAATRTENSFNKGLIPQNTSGHTGVSINKLKRQKPMWRAYITRGRKRYSLGCYENIEDAIMARKEGEKYYYGYLAS